MGWFDGGGGGPQLQNPTLRMLPGNDQRNAKAVIEGVDASGKTQWIEANTGNMTRYGMNPRDASPEKVQQFATRQQGAADRAELRQDKAARTARETLKEDRAYGLEVRRADLNEQSTNAQIANNERQLGINQQDANTRQTSAQADAAYRSGTLSLAERELLSKNDQFDRTHLLTQQKNAMDYNMMAMRLNNDIEAQSYDRRLRTMEGIGAAIAGLAAMIGG